MGAQDHPRIRGEHRRRARRGVVTLGSSPHTRGARQRRLRKHDRRQDHPRIRGEHWPTRVSASSETGSSPHTRGAPRNVSHITPLSRIIPAYAGSTRISCAGGPPARDHPRIRGEHIYNNLKVPEQAGSSPHTRGARARPDGLLGRQGIIPAYAGSTATKGRRRLSKRDHPRIRGEHDSITSSAILAFGSSPHTRGALAIARFAATHQRIIPAYAGSTSTASNRSSRPRDHPRIRGEHRYLND